MPESRESSTSDAAHEREMEAAEEELADAISARDNCAEKLVSVQHENEKLRKQVEELHGEVQRLKQARGDTRRRDDAG